ncbi:MAG: exonuclease SbcCD subunit D [Lachnospiraceae bacterium]|nr:exonuclease SbcCD subunit D [Lachnospiraceae bacterium]
MRFFHISDLHIGKQLYYYSLKENQRGILRQIVERVKEYRPDGILIAGDIFDKSVPSGEAYTIFDQFLNELAEISPQIPVFVIAGNHDSAERLRYASTFLEKHRIYVSTLPPASEEERLKKIVLEDAYGPVNVYLLPFTRPGQVRWLFAEGTAVTYDMAVQALIDREELELSERNVLVSHQFYVSGILTPDTCESEQAYISVGGIDSVDTSRVSMFDYVALGHLHGAQWIGKPSIRYCGTPLKYSVSEEKQKKSITLVTLGEKGSPAQTEEIFLEAEQDVRRERGTLEELVERAKAQDEGKRRDFVSITLTDEAEVFQPREQLEAYYPYILEIRVDNSRTRARLKLEQSETVMPDPLTAFQNFYQEMQGVSMNQEEREIMREVILKAKEEEA